MRLCFNGYKYVAAEPTRSVMLIRKCDHLLTSFEQLKTHVGSIRLPSEPGMILTQIMFYFESFIFEIFVGAQIQGFHYNKRVYFYQSVKQVDICKLANR